MHNKLIYFLTFSCPFSLFPMVSFPINTYYGQQITPQNLVALSKQDLPVEKEEIIQKWFYNHPEITYNVIQQKPFITDVRKFHQDNQELLKNAKIKCFQSPNNYVFSIPPIPEYVIKISGPSSRIFNLLVGLKKYRREAKLLQNLDEFHTLRNQHATYQTASEAATALRIKEFVESNPQAGIKYIPTHLIPLRECPSDATDTHSVIVKKYVDMQPLSRLSNKLTYFNLERITSLIELLKWAGLWELNANNMCVDAEGNLYCPDGEQPDNSNPQDFYHLNEQKYLWNISCGLECLYNLFPENSAERTHIRNIVMDDATFKKSNGYTNLLNLFMQNP